MGERISRRGEGYAPSVSDLSRSGLTSLGVGDGDPLAAVGSVVLGRADGYHGISIAVSGAAATGVTALVEEGGMTGVPALDGRCAGQRDGGEGENGDGGETHGEIGSEVVRLG